MPGLHVRQTGDKVPGAALHSRPPSLPPRSESPPVFPQAPSHRLEGPALPALLSPPGRRPLTLFPPPAPPLAGQLIQLPVQPPLELCPPGWVQGPVLGAAARVEDSFPADPLPGMGASPLPAAVDLRQVVAEAVPVAAVWAELAQGRDAGCALSKATGMISLNGSRDQGIEVLLEGQTCGHMS